jgi:hypothetical protein
MRGTRTAAHSTHPSTSPIMIPRHPFMTDTLHGLHAGVYPVYRGRISTAHQGDQMFDTLTEDERRMLGNKLADWGHAFAQVGNPLAFVALATEDPLTYGPIWTQGRRYQETMSEIYAVRTELVG